MFHLDAARRHILELRDSMTKKARRGPPQPGHSLVVFSPTVPIRDLQIANFGNLLARLSDQMEKKGGNTYIKSFATWREEGRTAPDIIKAVHRTGDPPVATRSQQLAFLTVGAPSLKHALHLIAQRCLHVGKAPKRTKLPLFEQLRICAWYTEVVLQHTYPGVGVMHSRLKQSDRSSMADDFNSGKSGLDILTQVHEVDAYRKHFSKQP
ncbi:MAG: hypothetical protein Q9170_000525 [Blastenia crenularia]